MICVADDHFSSVGGGRIVLIIAGNAVILGRNPIRRAVEESRHRAFPSAVKGRNPDRMLLWLRRLVVLDQPDDVILPVLGENGGLVGDLVQEGAGQ